MEPTSIARYVAIGDSLTAGTWDWGQGDPRAGFTYLLADALRGVRAQFEFNNLGVPGARTADVLRGQLDRAIQLHPWLLTVLIGVNDIPATPVAQFRADYGKLIDRLRHGTDGMIVAGNLPDLAHMLPSQFASQRAALVDRVNEFNAIIKSVTNTYEIPLVDLFGNPASADRQNISSDGVHPNPRGYRLLAKEFARVIGACLGTDIAIRE